MPSCFCENLDVWVSVGWEKEIEGGEPSLKDQRMCPLAAVQSWSCQNSRCVARGKCLMPWWRGTRAVRGVGKRRRATSVKDGMVIFIVVISTLDAGCDERSCKG